MPIFVKNYIWKQSDDKIQIQIQLRGVHSGKVDIFISEKFLKLNFPPFLFEVYLLKSIDEKNSSCIFTDTHAVIELLKIESIIWEQLEGDYDKAEKMRLKEEAIVEVQTKTRKMLDEKIKRKSDMERYVINKSIEMDTKEKQKMKDMQDKQKDEVMNDFELWRKNNENVKRRNEEVEKKIVKKVIPPIRNGGLITVTFTEREFPTPKRESFANDEEVWLKKNYEARKASGFVSEDLRPEEQDPQWCKDKGDELFRYGNYIGAINAYTHGIKLSDKLPSLYSNRAAAQYALGNFHRCIEDCSKALDLLTPKCQGNLKSRVTCIVRRSAALTRIGMLSKAIDEMKCAIKLQPDNEILKSDLYDMERAWEQDPDSD